MRVALLGTGIIGAAMGRNLLDAGHGASPGLRAESSRL